MMNILSPCFIAIILIFIYMFMPKPYQSKVKTFVNKNQLLIILVIGAYVYVNFEGYYAGLDHDKNENTCSG